MKGEKHIHRERMRENGVTERETERKREKKKNTTLAIQALS